MGPTSSVDPMGLRQPTVAVASRKRWRNAPYTGAATRIRCTPTQFWPAARECSGDAGFDGVLDVGIVQDDHGAFPPRSMESFFRPAVRAMLSPVENPPVKDTIRTSRDLNDCFGHFPVAVNNSEGFRREPGAHEGVREQLG